MTDFLHHYRAFLVYARRAALAMDGSQEQADYRQLAMEAIWQLRAILTW